ncbi:MAG: DnaD domain protein [Peptococcaceae bacterium]|nr:DnaD domain protein [Peptococcaceae bacterium]
MTNNNVYGGFSQALFFSGSVSIPSLLLDHYSDLGMTDREMMFVIHIILESGRTQDEQIDVQIMRKMGISSTDCKNLIQSLKQKGLLMVHTKTKKNDNRPVYDISGLIDQLFELWGINQYRQLEASGQGVKENNNLAAVSSSSSKLISLFEKELGRPLTGFECEHIEKWILAGHSEELIIEALRRGVSAGIRSFRYLDSILREWEKKGIQTLPEVEAEDQNFQSRQTKKGEKQTRSSVLNKNKYDNIYL